MIKKRLVKEGLSLGLVLVMCMATTLPAHAQNSQEMNNDVEISITDEQDSIANETDFENVDVLEPSEENVQKEVETLADSNADKVAAEELEKDEDVVYMSQKADAATNASEENVDAVKETQNEEKTSETPAENKTTTEVPDEATTPMTETEDEETSENTIDESRKAVSDEGIDSAEAANSFRIEGTVLKEYTGTGGAVTIPNYVTVIGYEAFLNKDAVTSVTIPNSVTSIGTGAFSGCYNITTVTFLPGSTLNTIGYEAFLDCTALQSIEIPDTVTSIGGRAFYNCAALKSVKLPKDLNELDGYTFYECITLKNVALGNKITKIGESAFSNCCDLKAIEIPDSVKEIGDWAFFKTALSSVQFGADLETIGSYAFGQCSNLTTINWNSKVRSIGHSAFSISAITDLILPNSVMNIGSNAFQFCNNLKTVVLGTGLRTIPSYAFGGCRNLQEVAINGMPTLIGQNAFENCYNLVNINIPDSVTNLQTEAFKSCTSLKNLKLGNGITDIGNSVFSGCSRLEALYLPYCLSECGENMISNCIKVTVYIPSNAAYAIQWAEEQQVRYELIEDFKPAAVTGLKAEPYGKNKVRLTWESSVGAEGYLVYGQKNGTYGYVGMTTTGTAFTDVKALDTDYNYYWVFPYVTNSDGKMLPGGTPQYVYAKGIIPAVLNLKPSSVVGGVRLTWTKYADAEGYLIYGIRGDNGKYGYIGMTTKGTTFTDTKAYKTQYNFYWVFPYHKNSAGKMIVGGTPKYVYGRAK